MADDFPATLRQCAILSASLDEVGGRPLVAWAMRELVRFGVEEFLFLNADAAPALERAVLQAAAALPKPVTVRFSVGPREFGARTALLHAAPHLNPRFLLCDGASLFDCNIAALLSDFAQDAPDVRGRMIMRDARDGACDPPASGARPDHVAAGIYALDRRILDQLAAAAAPENDLFAALDGAVQLRATMQHGWFVDTRIPADLARACSGLAAALHRPALFLDRDGVLNHDHRYVASVDRWDWIEGARNAVTDATNAGWHVFVVTNQSGVARGLYAESDVEALQFWLADELRRAGGTLDDWRFCPYHIDATVPAYRRDSDWRKPAPGMLNDLVRAWELDPAHCVMIGDRPSDMQAAAAAGMRSVLFQGGNLRDVVRPLLAATGPAP